MKPEQNIENRLSRLYAADVPESFETGWRADIRREESIQTMKNNSRSGNVFKKLVPALCALVLAVGGLWTGTLDMNGAELGAPQLVYESRSASDNMQVMYSSTGSTASYKMAADMDYAAEESYDTGMGTNGAVTTYGAQQTDRKLVRTADLSIRTDAYDEALEKVQTVLADMGGYIENLYQYGETSRRISLTIRVPSAKLDEFLSGVESLGRVTSRSESTTDMTVEYQDNQARLDTLYQKRDRLNELLLQAENVSDLIEIESAIADTQYQIDRYETSQRSIDRQVDMSMVTLSLSEQEKTVVNPELTLGERIAAGFKASIEWLGDFGRNVIVFSAMLSPALAAGVVLWLGWRLVRRLLGKKNKEE